MTSEERKIFRKVLREYLTEDAENHVAEYLEAHDIDPASVEVGYDYLVDRFEDEQDCNIAENIVWDRIVEEYFRSL